MSLIAGTKKRGPLNEDQYAGSMADAMEKAFRREWPVIMGSDAPEVNDHIRLLFVAIAQGVVKHLNENGDSIQVTVPAGAGSTYNAEIAVFDDGLH